VFAQVFFAQTLSPTPQSIVFPDLAMILARISAECKPRARCCRLTEGCGLKGYGSEGPGVANAFTRAAKIVPPDSF